MKGGKNERDGYRRRRLGSPSFADYGRGSAGAIGFHKITFLILTWHTSMDVALSISLQAAVDLIFSGWEGGDEAMQ